MGEPAQAVAPRITYEEQAEEVRRELGYRRRVYKRMVDDGRMTQTLMNHKIRVMEAVLETVEAQAQKERLI